MPKVMCVLNEHLATSKYYTNINYFFEELITEGKTFIAFCEHTHWVHARYPLKDPAELAFVVGTCLLLAWLVGRH